MVTTGAAPMIAVMKEELKNHPEKALHNRSSSECTLNTFVPLGSGGITE